MKRIFALVLCLAALASCGNGPKNQKVEEAPQWEELNQLALANLSVINMREDPDYAAELGTQALMGTPLKLHYAPENDYWVNVETPDGYKAWVNEMAVKIVTPEELKAWKSSRRVIVTSFYTFFVEEPKEGAQHVSDACWGCIVEYKGTSGKYTEVALPDGRKAFVPTADVMDFEEWAKSRKAVVPANASKSEVDAARQEVLNTAYKFIGVPYLWAGTSIKGVDCSGFSKSVYFLNGYVLLRNASQQYKTGESVDISQGLDNLEPADLIFFGREAKDGKPERISHVGIYIGNGKFIHSSELVRINDLTPGAPDEYYRKPIRAIRVIGNQDCGKDIVSVEKGDIYFENNN